MGGAGLRSAVRRRGGILRYCRARQDWRLVVLLRSIPGLPYFCSRLSLFRPRTVLGSVSCATTTLTPGGYTIEAGYSGDDDPNAHLIA